MKLSRLIVWNVPTGAGKIWFHAIGANFCDASVKFNSKSAFLQLQYIDLYRVFSDVKGRRNAILSPLARTSITTKLRSLIISHSPASKRRSGGHARLANLALLVSDVTLQSDCKPRNVFIVSNLQLRIDQIHIELTFIPALCVFYFRRRGDFRWQDMVACWVTNVRTDTQVWLSFWYHT